MGVVWASIETIGARLISFVSFLVLARLLSQEEFGLIALAMVYISFLHLVVRVGITEAIVQRDELSDLHKDTAFWATLILGLLALLASIGLAPLAAKWSDSAELENIVYWLAIGIIPISLSRVQAGLLLRDLHFRSLAIRNLISTSAGAVVGIAMALKGYGVWSLVAQQLVNRFVELLTLYWVVRWLPRFRFSRTALYELAQYSSRIMAINILSFFQSNIDRFLIGHFFGVAQLGVYVVGLRIIEVLFEFIKVVVGRVSLSAFSRMQTNLPQLTQASNTVAHLIALLGFPFMGLLIFYGGDITVAVFGEKWAEAGVISQIVAVGGLVRIATFFAVPLLKATGHPGKLVTANIVLVLTGTVAAVSLAGFGFNFFIMGWVSSTIFFGGMLIYIVKKILDYPLYGLAKLYSGLAVAMLGAWLIIRLLDTYLSSHLDSAIELTLARTGLFLLCYFLLISIFGFRTLKSVYLDVGVVTGLRKKKAVPRSR